MIIIYIICILLSMLSIQILQLVHLHPHYQLIHAVDLFLLIKDHIYSYWVLDLLLKKHWFPIIYRYYKSIDLDYHWFRLPMIITFVVVMPLFALDIPSSS